MTNEDKMNVSQLKFQAVYYGVTILTYMSLYYMKLSMWMLKLILSLPNALLNFNYAPITNNLNEKVELIDVKNEFGDITNKVKLFLKFCLEKVNETSPFKADGFDASSIHSLLGCFSIYYLLKFSKKELNGEITTIYQKLQTIYTAEKNAYLRILDNNDKVLLSKRLFLNHLDLNLDNTTSLNTINEEHKTTKPLSRNDNEDIDINPQDECNAEHSQVDSEYDAEPKDESDAEPKSESDAEPKSEYDAEPKSESDAEEVDQKSDSDD